MRLPFSRRAGCPYLTISKITQQSIARCSRRGKEGICVTEVVVGRLCESASVPALLRRSVLQHLRRRAVSARKPQQGGSGCAAGSVSGEVHAITRRALRESRSGLAHS